MLDLTLAEGYNDAIMESIRTKNSTVWMCVLVALVAADCLGADPPDKGAASPTTRPALDKRYTDMVNGFSLRPPMGFQRSREYSPGRLVSWSHRDPKTGAIDLTLTVLRRTESKLELDIKPYSQKLAQKLADEEKFEVKAIKLIKVAQKDAIDLNGRHEERKGLWQRQVWIWAHPRQFLIIAAVGPLGYQKRVDATCQAVLDSFEVVDPVAAAKARRENLTRGMDLLASVTDEKLNKIFTDQRTWFLMKMKDKDVGYMSVSTRRARVEGVNGYEVRSLVKLSLPGDRPRRAWRVQFTTADRSFTHWTDSMVAGAGRQAIQIIQNGIMQKDVVVCNVATGGGEEPKTKPLSGAKAFFLPKAMGMVLTQMVDLTKPQAYSFATYNAVANGLDMRTFTVVGPQSITIAGREVACIHVTDRAAADAEEAQLWLNSAGELLRMKTAEGLIMEASTETAVLRRFPAEEMHIKAPRQ